MKKKLTEILSLTLCLAMFAGTSLAESTATNESIPPAAQGDNGGTPPELPDGQAPDGQQGTPPEMPDGQAPDGQQGTPPEMPDGQAPQGMGGQPGGAVGAPESYAALAQFTEDTTESDSSYDSTGTDESAVLVSGGANVTLNGAEISRDSQDSTGGDSSSFYGVGAAALVTDGTLTISGGSITSDAKGGAGVFAYGTGTAYVSDTTISTAQDTSGGIHAAGGGTLYAWNLNVETQGESSAAIRSDRGGGTMVVDGGSYTANGSGSPAVYCTADIAVNNATLTANGSEGVCIEGLNTLNLFDCALSSNMADDAQNDNTWSVIVYQSMSGDSEIGCGSFRMVGGSLDSTNGGLFYTTNTESSFVLENVDITAAEDSEYFLRCTGNANQRGWGSSGANGADCSFTAINQQMNGQIIYDSISNLDFYMLNSSALTGSFVDDESCAGEGGDGACSVYIDEGSVWTVTADCSLTSLSCAGTLQDADGNTVSVVGTDGTVYVEGTGARTVTVGSYSAACDLTGAGSTDSFASYAVDQPVV